MALGNSKRPRAVPSLVTLAVVACAPGVASAEGWYTRADVGASVGGSADINGAAPMGGDASYEDGSLLSAGLGYAVPNGWRFEAELSRRDNDLDAAALLDPGGSVETIALMANIYRDLGTGKVKPYFGLGFGVAQSELQATFTPPLNPPVVDNDDTGLAYQIMLGATFDTGSRVVVEFGYRYFVAPGFEGTGVTPPATAFPVEADFEQHALAAGLRWNF
jgi:opacity protein-like surface antigen